MKKLNRGMVKDTALVDQPEGTMRDALNANLNVSKGSIVNEYGTVEYPANADFRVFGRIVLEDDRIVMFGMDTDGRAVDQIRIMNPRNQQVVVLYENVNLNFRESHVIVCVSRKNQANEHLVYFTDGYRKEERAYPGFDYVSEYNPPRVINVSKQLEWRQSGGLVTELYNLTNSHRKLELVPYIGAHSTIDEAFIKAGGALPSAAYYLAIAYADKDGVETNYFTLANPVYVVPGEENAVPTNTLIGAEGGTPTNKAIKWVVSIPENVEYSLIQPAIIRLINEEQTAFKLPLVKANAGGKTNIVYTGTESALPISSEDIIVDDVHYTSAGAIAQLDNRLYLGNVTANKDIGFQPFAHNIEIKCKSETVANFNPRVFDTFILNQGYAAMLQTFDSAVGSQYFKSYTYNASTGYEIDQTYTPSASYAAIIKNIVTSEGETLKGYRSPKYSFKKKSYRRGEVYAFYISFVLKDGTETYAYHIPGRTALPMDLDNTIFESDELGSKSPEEMKNATGFRPEEFLNQAKAAKIFQAVDTSTKVNGADTLNMGFWENENEYYPTTSDFLQGIVSAEGDVELTSSTLSGERVRHHKFPSNLSAKSFVQRAVGSNSTYQEQARKLPATTSSSPPPSMSTADNPGQNSGIVLYEEIRLLGIELRNIKLPKYILAQVQGYKIYYAKRTKQNRTVLGQGVAVPGHPRYASVKEQALEDAIKGPYKKAFYMYGGLDDTGFTGIDTIGDWKSNNGTVGQKKYWAHPVFKIHDFSLLKDRSDLSSATHIQAQFGLVFRMYQGGPSVFIDPCAYHKIDEVPSDAGAAEGNYTEFNDVDKTEQHTTTFPSLGWVSPDMRNTVDFYWHDPLHIGNFTSEDKELFGLTRILDISDTLEGEAAAGSVTDGNEQTLKPAKRARRFRKGEDLSQPAEGDFDSDAEQLLACEAKRARIRAWYTSTMIATVYASPAALITSKWNIKAGDWKEATNSGSAHLNRFYSEASFDDNQFTLTIEPTGKILLPGREDYESNDSSSFKGASYLYNRAGETAHAISLTSGLPALRGHLPFYSGQAANIEAGGYRVGLTIWGQSNKWLFPDAAIYGVPLNYQRYGNSPSPTAYYTEIGNGTSLYQPSQFRGYKYALSMSNQFDGLPMAWMVNICSYKTDIYNPFDQQPLVWTGFYKRINDANIESGAASDGEGNTTNYYTGAISNNIFGGDTYITRHGVRTTSQSYGHSFFRAAQNWNDPVANSLSNDSDLGSIITDQGLASYLNNAITTQKYRQQGDIPAQLDPTTTANTNRFGTTNGVPIWNWASTAANDASGSASPYDAAVNTLQVLKDTWNWEKGNVNPVSTLMYFYCESDDLIEFRHIKDTEKGEETKIFDYHNAASMIFEPPVTDYTNPDKILYSSHFSSLQDKKVASPLPVYAELAKEGTFPRRVVRSDIDSGSLADGYRKFRALEYKDIPSQRGDIKSMFDYRGLMYMNTSRSLFFTKGKEELQIGSINAFIGSGDIFSQSPSEVQESNTGFGGTSSRHCNVTTEHGHFYLNYRDGVVYKAGGESGLVDVSNGIEVWLRDNMPFALEEYGINLDSADAEENGFYTDAPTALSTPIGFTMGYDPEFARILITKREPVPTQAFLDDFQAGKIVIYNNIPYIINLDDDKCTDPTTIDTDEGSVDFTRQKESQGTDGLDVYCGPIWFGNPKYFKQSGWTISYYPQTNTWGSRHSYLPSLYTNTSEQLVSFAEGIDSAGTTFWGSWEHSNKKNPGRFYGTLYNFEIEYIDNSAQAEPKIFSNVYYWAEGFLNTSNNLTQYSRISSPIFNTYYAYNSTQITGTPTAINYLNNARLVDRVWYINELRDMASTEDIRDGELITNTENVAGYITSSVTAHPQSTAMFLSEGEVNPDYVDTNKEWYSRRKLIDHFIGVRLIHDNSNRNLVHLYAVGTKFRKSYR